MLASLNPKRLTTLLEASERLFTASATTETEPVAMPTAPLARHSATLHAMQTMLATRPYLVRT